MSPNIFNHKSATLSDLDMQIVHSVPQGGNWKDIPESVPSKRVKNIREAYNEGKGSRSTYYGRLEPDMPSYTINTYFNRPGNGCHIHYNEDRVLSQREAARLQSFPDSFAFLGSSITSINKQIGNAVPPLMAYQIAKQIGYKGYFVDLFCGAGGLGLGFKWAGWKPIVANDIEENFLKTYKLNVHDNVVKGSIIDEEIKNTLLDVVNNQEFDNKPIWVLGGPPCQGFSTAGKKRTMDDKRNHLFWEYKKFLDKLNPEGFIFENVMGLLNMNGGQVFETVNNVFQSTMPMVKGWLLSTDEYAIPQRRKRVFLIGNKDENFDIESPERITSTEKKSDLFEDLHKSISVKEALLDLPALKPGEDESYSPYKCDSQTTYQAFMRGIISPKEYIQRIKNGKRYFKASLKSVV